MENSNFVNLIEAYKNNLRQNSKQDFNSSTSLKEAKSEVNNGEFKSFSSILKEKSCREGLNHIFETTQFDKQKIIANQKIYRASPQKITQITKSLIHTNQNKANSKLNIKNQLDIFKEIKISEKSHKLNEIKQKISSSNLHDIINDIKRKIEIEKIQQDFLALEETNLTTEKINLNGILAQKR